MPRPKEGVKRRVMFLFRQGTKRAQFLFLGLILGGFVCPSSGQTRAPKPIPDDVQETESGFFSWRLLLELDWGWHSVSDSRYKEVYSEGNRMLTFAVHPLWINEGRHSFGPAAGIKNFSKKGTSTVTQEEARLTLLSLFLGVEYTVDLKPFYPGIEMGVDHCFYRERSPLMNTRGSTTGYHVQGQLMLQIPGSTFLKLKLFIRHSKLPTKEITKVNLGGLEYGAGILIELF
jgi:hypothetical protein